MKPIDAPRLVEIDYAVQGEWIDGECLDCAKLNGQHEADCGFIAHLWGDLARE
jgi:hypothetical protein